MNKFDALIGEADCLASAWGFDFIEAMEYIRDNFEEYRGTEVARQFRLFLQDGAKMFAPVTN